MIYLEEKKKAGIRRDIAKINLNLILITKDELSIQNEN